MCFDWILREKFSTDLKLQTGNPLFCVSQITRLTNTGVRRPKVVPEFVVKFKAITRKALIQTNKTLLILDRERLTLI